MMTGRGSIATRSFYQYVVVVGVLLVILVFVMSRHDQSPGFDYRALCLDQAASPTEVNACY